MCHLTKKEKSMPSLFRFLLLASSFYATVAVQANYRPTRVYMVETEMPFKLHSLGVHHRGLRFTDSRGARGFEYHFCSDRGVEEYEVNGYNQTYVQTKELGTCPYSADQCRQACNSYRAWTITEAAKELRARQQVPDFVPTWVEGALNAMAASSDSASRSAKSSSDSAEAAPIYGNGYRLFRRDCWDMTKQVARHLGFGNACLERPVAVTRKESDYQPRQLDKSTD